jgi:hypothetical protein
LNESPYSSDASREAYPAPPAWRPMSAMAILSLVLAILLALVAFLGLWWVEVFPLLLGLFALSATGPMKKRGKGIAIAGVVVAAAAGAFAFAVHRGIEIAIEDHFKGFVAALDGADPVKAATFAAEPEKAAAAIPTWIARAAAARERLGAYSGKLSVGSLFFGIAGAFVPPKDVDEVEPRGAKDPDHEATLWARVKYERGTAWFSISGDPEKLKDMKGEKIPPVVTDVRVYLPKAGSDGK